MKANRFPPQPAIRNLAFIGDQKSCAAVDTAGTISWYCLWRFDQPSLFSLLVDEQGGFWSVEAEGKDFKKRMYKENTTVLETTFRVAGGSFTVTDFMPSGADFSGICRLVSSSPVPVTCRIYPTPNHGRSKASLKRKSSGRVVAEEHFEFYIKASHPVNIKNGVITLAIPAHQHGWCILLDEKKALRSMSLQVVQQAFHQTIQYWSGIMNNISYAGVYEKEFRQSYKAVQLALHAHSGGILAAVTTSLPEIIGGNRNYDYRYVWLRDTAMLVSALVRAGSKGNEAERFLDFLCAARNTNKKNLFVPFYDLDNKVAPFEEEIKGSGFCKSIPVRIGNNANEQLQLDGQGNVLLAAKQVYNEKEGKPHWATISATADFLVKHWMQKDHGIWEEQQKQHYTSSKVLVAKSLEFLAEHAEDKKKKQLWLDTAKEIRQFVKEKCLTSYGAYAVYAGSDDVDITAALYPIWWFDEADSIIMQKTIARLEDVYSRGDLYHRHLVESNWREEGVFLAASLWMAQYYVVSGNLPKAKRIIDAVLSFSTDLGFLPEEGDPKTGELLGNIPQTFVHASLIGVILDYNEALQKPEKASTLKPS